jgi:phosphatidylglycerol:prolipoprotein diacylglycerol transferase
MLGSRSAAISGIPAERTAPGHGASPTRILFHWRGVPIYAYPAMLSLGIAIGSIVTNCLAHLAGADAVRVYVATVLLLGPALIGARVLHVMAHRDLYRREPARIWRRSDGGASLYGGLLVALVLSPPVLWLLDVPFWTFWDLATFTLLSGMVFAKIGCHLNGCCAGRPIAGFPGLVLSDHHGVRARRMPSQLLEAGWALLLLLALAVLRTGAPPPGTVILAAVAGYGVGRILLESTREGIDQLRGWSLHGAISVALVLLALGAFVARWRGIGVSD